MVGREVRRPVWLHLRDTLNPPSRAPTKRWDSTTQSPQDWTPLGRRAGHDGRHVDQDAPGAARAPLTAEHGPVCQPRTQRAAATGRGADAVGATPCQPRVNGTEKRHLAKFAKCLSHLVAGTRNSEMLEDDAPSMERTPSTTQRRPDTTSLSGSRLTPRERRVSGPQNGLRRVPSGLSWPVAVETLVETCSQSTSA